MTVVVAAAMYDGACVIICSCFAYVTVHAVPPDDAATASWHEVGMLLMLLLLMELM